MTWLKGVPPLARLQGVDPGELHARMAHHARDVGSTSYDHAWQKQRAYVEAIDAALRDVAGRRRVEPAPKPRWLEGVVARELDTASGTSWSQESFRRVRLLERLGAVECEPDDTYVLAMVSALGDDKAATLREDPELVERALWRVFEVEGGGEVSLTNIDRFGGDGWRTAFLELVADGTLDRDRVLTSCLEALGRDFLAYRAAWFSATYLALEPDDAEVAGHQPALRRLVGSAVPATVAFAVKLLARLHKAGSLDAGPALDVLAPATLAKAKGTALAALRLARDAGKDRPDAVVRVASAALGHPHADVQRAAATLLEEYDGHAAVSAARDDLAPAVQQELGLEVRTVDDAEPLDQPLVDPVAPPATDGELAERVAALLEDASDAAALEAVLAALVRPGSEEALVPLRKRAQQVVARGPRTDWGGTWLPGQVARLVLGLTGEPAPAALPDVAALAFVVRRIGELRASEAPLLATPDLPGGWVSPAALVERLGAHDPRHHDLVAALLRLHPDGRAEVPTDGLPDAVRFALDGDQRGRTRGPAAWWVAAQRSRSTYTDAEAPRPVVEIGSHQWEQGGKTGTSRWAHLPLRWGCPNPPAPDQPTELGTGEETRFSGPLGSASGDWIPTLAAVWPHDAEHLLVHTARTVLDSPNWPEAAHDVPRVLDALARHPGRLGVVAVHTLAAGLSSAQRHHRMHAVDAFLDLVPTGRIAAADVADVLVALAETWPASRWAESFGSVAQGPGGGRAAVEVLTSLLPRLPAGHRGLNKLLDLLHDELLRQGRRVTDPALQQWLGTLTGSSAAARTARRLLG